MYLNKVEVIANIGFSRKKIKLLKKEWAARFFVGFFVFLGFLEWAVLRVKILYL